MAESIRKFKNNDELIKDLENRNLIFPNDESKKIFKIYLKQYGYFSFIKKMSNNLMYEDLENKNFKKEFTSNNLRYLFDIDRNNSVIVFKYFRNIEFLFNSSLLKVIAKKINKNAKCPYIGALDSEGLSSIFPNIIENTPYFKKINYNSYFLFYKDIFKNFNNIDFDCKKAIEENKNNESDEIKDLINKGWFFNSIKNNFKQIKFLANWEYLDIFSLFQTLSFSQLIRIFSYLSNSLQNEVIKEFFNDYKPKNKYLKLRDKSFMELINLFSNLRNVLMHNGSLMKFNHLIKDLNTKKEIEEFFDISIPNDYIRLKESIYFMESIINIQGLIFNEMNEVIRYKFKNKTNRNDKISKLIFDIYENESRIKFEANFDD